MTIGKKIVAGYALVLALLATVAATGLYSLTAIHGAYSEFIDLNAEAIVGATELKLEVREQTAQYRGFLLYPEERQRLENDLHESYRKFDGVVEKLKNMSRSETGPNALEEIASLQARHKAVQEEIGRASCRERV